MIGFQSAPIIIGSEAMHIPEGERAAPELSHSWRVYVKIQPSVVKSVQFRLHESFANPLVTISEPPFEIRQFGWGEFSIQIRIVLFNDERIMTNHYLVLHGASYPVISERMDSVVYKGKAVPVDPKYTFEYEGEEDEYRRIDSAINHLLDQYEHVKNEQM